MTPRDPDVLGIVTEGLRRNEYFGRYAFAYGQVPTAHARTVEAKIRRRQNEILAEEFEREARERARALLAEIRGLDVPNVPLKPLIRLAVEITGSPWVEMIGKSRAAPIVARRHFTWWLVRTRRPGLSFPALGRIFHRDHTTIIQGLKRVRKRLDKSPFAAWIADPRLEHLLSKEDWR